MMVVEPVRIQLKVEASSGAGTNSRKPTCSQSRRLDQVAPSAPAQKPRRSTADPLQVETGALHGITDINPLEVDVGHVPLDLPVCPGRGMDLSFLLETSFPTGAFVFLGMLRIHGVCCGPVRYSITKNYSKLEQSHRLVVVHLHDGALKPHVKHIEAPAHVGSRCWAARGQLVLGCLGGRTCLHESSLTLCSSSDAATRNCKPCNQGCSATSSKLPLGTAKQLLVGFIIPFNQQHCTFDETA